MNELLRTAFTGIFTRAAIAYVGAVAAYLALFRLLRRQISLHAIAVFPGTLSHELAHWTAGTLCGARPTGLRLWPQRSGNDLVLGKVGFANLRWYNGAFVGLAPLSLLAAAAVLVEWRARFAPGFGTTGAAWAYLIACLVYSSIPSKQDLRIMAISLPLLIGMIGLAGIALAWGR